MDKYRKYALVAAAYLGTFIACLDISIVNVALPTIQSDLQVNWSGLQWVVNVYAVALSAVMLSAGPLGDRYGHKRVWLYSVLLFVIGSAICASSQHMGLLLCGRAVQGVAGALLIPGALPILTDAFSDSVQRARAIGGWSAFGALALISGPLIGGYLVEYIGWESVFLVNIPLGFITILLGLWGIPERKYPDKAAFDPVGQLLSMLWLGMLSYGLIESGEHGLAFKTVLVPLGIALMGLVAFIWVELHVRRPMIPAGLFKNGTLLLANISSFVLGFSSYSSLFFLSLYLQQIKGSSPAMTGWELMPQFLMQGIVSILFGRLSIYFSVRRLMTIGYLLVGGALCFISTFSPDTHYFTIRMALGLLGVGCGLAIPATGMVVMGYAPPHLAGIASAVMNTLRQTGMAIGIAILGSLMSLYAMHEMIEGMRHYGIHDRHMAHMAVMNHEFSAQYHWLHGVYQHAMAGGFSLAMMTAGASCLLVACLFLFYYGTCRQPSETSFKKAKQ